MNVYSVSQINNYIKNLFENDYFLNDVCINGEISNFKAHTSGHLYLTLKDSDSAISAVMFRQYAQNIKFLPENGMSVMASGHISVYEKTGQYQLYITKIEPSGKGALYLAYEQLKEKLEKSGVFDQKYKRPIPQYPRCVAVITSPTGAAVRDIINVSGRRNPNVEIVVVPTLVQGDLAADDIVKAIDMVNRWGKADVIILGRGGGSIEDLWAFNEEKVARAIFDSNIPIISAVGHETDFTIADFISDMRAPTPSAGAEIAVPDNSSISVSVRKYTNDITHIMNGIIDSYNYRCKKAVNSYAFRHIYDYIVDNQIYVDNLTSKLNSIINNQLSINKIELEKLVDNLENKSPMNILKKGYSIVYNKGRIVKSADDVNNNDDIDIVFNEGSIKARVVK